MLKQFFYLNVSENGGYLPPLWWIIEKHCIIFHIRILHQNLTHFFEKQEPFHSQDIDINSLPTNTYFVNFHLQEFGVKSKDTLKLMFVSLVPKPSTAKRL